MKLSPVFTYQPQVVHPSHGREPSLKGLVQKYYQGHGFSDHKELTEKYFADLLKFEGGELNKFNAWFQSVEAGDDPEWKEPESGIAWDEYVDRWQLAWSAWQKRAELE